MKLRHLDIELRTYGEEKGRYIGTLQFQDANNTEVKLELTAEQAEKFVQFSAPILMAAADNAAEQFKSKLLASLPQVAQLA